MTLLHRSIALFMSLGAAFVAQAAENVFVPHESVILEQKNIANPTVYSLREALPEALANYITLKLPEGETFISYRKKMLSDYRYFTPAHTQNTIKNMKESVGKKGLFFVHGVEPFEKWVGEFSEERMAEFIEGYPELLSKRYLIAGSIIGGLVA